MKNIFPNINTGLFIGLTLFLVIILSPKPDGLSSEAWYVAAVGVLIAVLWASEAIPLFVTALFPLVFFPLLGVSSFADTAIPYANKNIFLFLGGFILALSIQKSNLHERIALNILRFAGRSGPSFNSWLYVCKCFFIHVDDEYLNNINVASDRYFRRSYN